MKPANLLIGLLMITLLSVSAMAASFTVTQPSDFNLSSLTFRNFNFTINSTDAVSFNVLLWLSRADNSTLLRNSTRICINATACGFTISPIAAGQYRWQLTVYNESATNSSNSAAWFEMLTPAQHKNWSVANSAGTDAFIVDVDAKDTYVPNNLYVGNNATVQQSLTVNNFISGNQSANVTPGVDSKFYIGTPGMQWLFGFFDTVKTDAVDSQSGTVLKLKAGNVELARVAGGNRSVQLNDTVRLQSYNPVTGTVDNILWHDNAAASTYFSGRVVAGNTYLADNAGMVSFGDRAVTVTDSTVQSTSIFPIASTDFITNYAIAGASGLTSQQVRLNAELNTSGYNISSPGLLKLTPRSTTVTFGDGLMTSDFDTSRAAIRLSDVGLGTPAFIPLYGSSQTGYTARAAGQLDLTLSGVSVVNVTNTGVTIRDNLTLGNGAVFWAPNSTCWAISTPDGNTILDACDGE